MALAAKTVSAIYREWNGRKKQYLPWRNDPSERIYAAEPSRCHRKAVMRLLKYVGEQPSSDSKAAMDAGVWWESYLAAVTMSAAEVSDRVERWIPIGSPFGNWQADLVVTSAIPNGESASGTSFRTKVVEVKSTTSDRLNFLPDPMDEDQLLFYLRYGPWRRDVGDTLAGELVYALRDTGTVLSFEVPYDPERVEALIAAASQIQAAVRSGVPPNVPASYTPDRFPCGWSTGRCAYWLHCWGG